MNIFTIIGNTLFKTQTNLLQDELIVMTIDITEMARTACTVVTLLSIEDYRLSNEINPTLLLYRSCVESLRNLCIQLGTDKQNTKHITTLHTLHKMFTKLNKELMQITKTHMNTDVVDMFNKIATLTSRMDNVIDEVKHFL